MTLPYSLDDSVSSKRAIHALIVDDEPHFLNTTRMLVGQHLGWVDSAATGREAIAMLDRENYDLVLLDLMLPDCTGHEIMNFIRTKRPETLVIVVSGDTSIEAAIKALRSGAYDYLRKPYEPEQLLKTVRNAVQKLELWHDNQQYQQQIKQSEHWHRLLVNLSPDIIYTLDAEGNFTYLNESVESLLGYRRDELLGQSYQCIVYDEDREPANCRMNERRTGERATRNFELRLKRKASDAASDLPQLVVELSSMGLYRPSTDGKTEFIGTYGVARDVSARKQAEATIHFQAYHDLLTGLPNRTLFRERLSQSLIHAQRYQHQLAVMFLDMDRFKTVNDTLGHLIGDQLLQSVSQRIRACLRDGDTLARIGGDEFMLLLPHIRSRDNAGLIASKVLETLKAPFHLDGHELFVGMSIGIATMPDDGVTMDTLIKHADIAMYHAKDNGRNGFSFFNPDLNTPISGRLALETDIRRALQRSEFEAFYQPRVDIASSRIVGMEALARWRHPERGMVSPGDFIPLAEDTGLIGPISERVLQHVCQQSKLWQEAGLPPIRLAVNLSARQIEHPHFVEKFVATLDANAVSPEHIGIELTESTLMRDLDGSASKLKRLSDLGMEISVDDFGTGYSSLSYLKKLPIHTLKIDQSFIHDIDIHTNGTSIVAGIAAMAKGLRLHLVAEGVETPGQLAYLESVGCDAYQGYLFSKPLSASDAGNLLQPILH
ncbi:MAG: EAL domain-containing protein [Hydrogenophilaceae bacterium]|nr:EAL domain-containing protein [Hydrogenophilaceae bacterium]